MTLNKEYNHDSLIDEQFDMPDEENHDGVIINRTDSSNSLKMKDLPKFSKFNFHLDFEKLDLNNNNSSKNVKIPPLNLNFQEIENDNFSNGKIIKIRRRRARRRNK